VLNTKNIPAEKLISIRAGGTTRKVQLSALQSPLKFPVAAESLSTVKVEVLDLLGFSRVALNPAEEQYNVVLDTMSSNATATDAPMEVQLKVKSVGDREVARSQADEDARKEIKAKDYLDEHNLVNFLQTLLHGLMKDKPVDPYRYLHREISRKAAESGGAHSPQASTLAGASNIGFAMEERGAAAQREQLKADNESLRECLETELAEKTRLQEELERLQKEKEATSQEPEVDPSDMTAEQLVAYNEMLSLQNEIASLARENAMFVAKMARVRLSMESVRTEISTMQQAVK